MNITHVCYLILKQWRW